MKRFSGLLLIAALAASGLVLPAHAQSFADASMTLERAVHAEMVSGDLDRAIALYREVAESISASREDVAKALVALGRSYELTGSDEAEVVYGRLVSEFPDQPEEFLAAREALGRMGSQGNAAGFVTDSDQDYDLMLGDTPFNVHFGPWGRSYDISPDGTTIVFSAKPLAYRAAMYPKLENELYFVKTGSTVWQPVIEDAGDWIGAPYDRWLPRWSPDGHQILFRARRHNDATELVFARRDLSSNTTFLLPDVPTGNAPAWMPDSKRFIVNTGGFDLYSIDGPLIRHFAMGNKWSKRLGDVSPDGRYVSYLKAEEGPGTFFHFNVWLMDLRSGEHLQVTHDGGMKGVPAWSRDSKAVYYTWGPESGYNLYKKVIGTDSGPEQITSYSNASVFDPVVLAGSGQLTYALKHWETTVLTAPADSPELAREVIRGSSPMLSPDGKMVFYWDYSSTRGGLWSATLDGQSPKQLITADRADLEVSGPSLSPDGKQIAYFLHGADGVALYTMPSGGGASQQLFSGIVEVWGVPAWSPDSKELAFPDGPDLRVVSAGGGPAQSIARSGSWGGTEIVWSPDGKYVAAPGFVTPNDTTGGRWDNILYAINRRTRDVKELTNLDESSYREGLSWHPDSDRISYVISTDSGYETRIVSLAGGPTTTLIGISENVSSYWGRWGLDGRYYFLNTEPTFDLFVLPGDGQEPVPFIRATKERRMYPLPSWSEDGAVIVWSEESENIQIWSVTDRK